jgi:hypothetical protein
LLDKNKLNHFDRIPFERALEIANEKRITQAVYPLFVHDIATFFHNSEYPKQYRSSIRDTKSVAAPAYSSDISNSTLATTGRKERSQWPAHRKEQVTTAVLLFLRDNQRNS